MVKCIVLPCIITSMAYANNTNSKILEDQFKSQIYTIEELVIFLLAVLYTQFENLPLLWAHQILVAG